MAVDQKPVMPIHHFLREHRDALFAQWKIKIRDRLRADVALTDEQLVDCLPLFLDDLIFGLEQHGGRLVEEHRSAASRVHGSQRYALSLPIDDVIREYSVFFSVIVEYAEEQGIFLTSWDLGVLSEVLFTAASEASLEHGECEARDRQKAERQRIGYIAHEFRNPLATARMAWDLLRSNLDLGGGTFCRAIDVSLERLFTLVDQTLSLTRLSEGDRAPNIAREAVGLDALLADVEADARFDAEKKTISISIDSETSLRVPGDHARLLSALTDLVRHAVKFTPAGGAVVIRSRLEEQRVLIEVRDECGGLAPDAAERLFQRFMQAGQNHSDGVRLAIAKQDVEAHKGTLMVRNVPDTGCVFVVDLPAAPGLL